MSSYKQCNPPKERIGRLLKDGKTRRCEIPCKLINYKKVVNIKHCQDWHGLEYIKNYDKYKDTYLYNDKLEAKLEKREKELVDFIRQHRGQQDKKKILQEYRKELKQVRNDKRLAQHRRFEVRTDLAIANDYMGRIFTKKYGGIKGVFNY